MNTTRPVVFIVAVPIAFVLVAYVATLCILTLYNISPDPKVLEYLQVAGVGSAASLIALLAQTRGTNTADPASAPPQVKMVNTPQNPGNVQEVPKPKDP